MRRLVWFVVAAGLVVVLGNWLTHRYVHDEPNFFTRTADYQTISNDTHGFSFAVSSERVKDLDVRAWPNPDQLTPEEWAKIKLNTEVNSTSYGLATVVMGNDTIVLNNGYNILELSVTGWSDQEIEDVLQSRRVIERNAWQPVDNDYASPFDNLASANQSTPDVVSITGNDQLDEKIRRLAEQRGYKKRYSVEDTSVLISVDNEPVRSHVADAWVDLAAAAQQAGFDLFVVSGYRDVELQVEIFNATLSSNRGPLSDADLLSEVGNQVIDEVLKTVAVPGYSKHHTGWVVDITQVGFNTFDFANTPAFSWLAKNNYENARRFGFLPSYPENGPQQGPDPEAWEYVYVGRDYLGFLTD